MGWRRPKAQPMPRPTVRRPTGKRSSRCRNTPRRRWPDPRTGSSRGACACVLLQTPPAPAEWRRWMRGGIPADRVVPSRHRWRIVPHGARVGHTRSMAEPIPFILDCDPGHDDALAMILGIARPELDLLAVTTVAGNSDLASTTANALRVLTLAGRTDIPVAAGAAGPLLRPLHIALLLRTHPEVAERIESLRIMGGAVTEGNTTASAEFNIWQDPEAARIVFDAGRPIVMMPLDVTHQALFTDADVERLVTVGTRPA